MYVLRIVYIIRSWYTVQHSTVLIIFPVIILQTIITAQMTSVESEEVMGSWANEKIQLLLSRLADIYKYL